MPIYEYQCQACAHDIEVIQKLSDPPLEECPSCGELTLKKKISAAAFRLKGGGWYETDFKTGDKKNIAGDGDKAAAGGDKAAGESKGGDSGGKSSGTSSDSASGSGSSSKNSGNSSSPAAAN